MVENVKDPKEKLASYPFVDWKKLVKMDIRDKGLENSFDEKRRLLHVFYL